MTREKTLIGVWQNSVAAACFWQCAFPPACIGLLDWFVCRANICLSISFQGTLFQVLRMTANVFVRILAAKVSLADLHGNLTSSEGPMRASKFGRPSHLFHKTREVHVFWKLCLSFLCGSKIFFSSRSFFLSFLLSFLLSLFFSFFLSFFLSFLGGKYSTSSLDWWFKCLSIDRFSLLRKYLKTDPQIAWS